MVDRIFPLGTYKKMMGAQFDTLMSGVLDGAMALPFSSIAKMSGLDETAIAGMEKTSLDEVMTILDPAFRERMQVSTRAMTESLTGLMTQMEPAIRAGLARAYARKFSEGQLKEIGAFFATPTGSAYAAEYFSIMMDPEIMREITGMMPAMLERMPELMGDVGKATASLPPPRRISELSKAERARLARLLGIEERDLREVADDEDGGET